jgi:integrase
MRRGELLSLKWEDVDLTKQTATLHDTKNGDARIVPLSKRAIDVLKTLQKKRDEDKVVTLDRRVLPISAQSLKCSWERGRKRADMEHFNFHDLRHEAISRLFERGWDAIKVAAVLEPEHAEFEALRQF